jgi:hypothetical protein
MAEAFPSFPSFPVDPDKDSNAEAEPPKQSSLLESVLGPLLEDFVYWFERSQTLLQTERLSGLEPQAQAELLARVEVALEQVKTSKTLLRMTDGQAGVDMAVVAPWHQLVHECWGVAIQHRRAQGGSQAQPPEG